MNITYRCRERFWKKKYKALLLRAGHIFEHSREPDVCMRCGEELKHPIHLTSMQLVKGLQAKGRMADAKKLKRLLFSGFYLT